MAEDRKNDQEQQELDELTVLQDAEKGDLSAEEHERVEGVEDVSFEQSDLAGTVLAGSSVHEGAVAADVDVESTVAENATEEVITRAAAPEIVTDTFAEPTESAATEGSVEEPAAEVVEPEVAEEVTEAPAEPTESIAVEEAVEEPAAEIVEPEVAEEVTEAPAGPNESAVAEEAVEAVEPELAEEVLESPAEPTESAAVEESVEEPAVEVAEPEVSEEVLEAPAEPTGSIAVEEAVEAPEYGVDEEVFEAPTESVEATEISDDSGQSSGGQGNQWVRVEDGPDQGKGGDQDFDSESDFSFADGAEKGAPKGNMGLGNGLDEAPPGVTEDQPHYDERVEGAGEDSSEGIAPENVVEEFEADADSSDFDEFSAEFSDDSEQSSGGRGNQWGRVEDGPDQGKGGDQEFDSESDSSADGAEKGGPKGNMGLGNGLDEAPPGVTEDQPHYDERVEGAGEDDALETDFFLMESDEGESGYSWTELTEGEDSGSGAGMDDLSNGWTEEVESDEDGGKGKGRGKKGGDDDDSFDSSDNLDAFENEAEDFPDQSDW